MTPQVKRQLARDEPCRAPVFVISCAPAGVAVVNTLSGTVILARYIDQSQKSPEEDMSSQEWVETLYIAPGHYECRVYAMPYPLAPNQNPTDLATTHQLHDWREIAKLDRDHALVYIEPGYADFSSDIVGREGGSHFEVTRHAA
jgi:hypothetical protein